MKLGLLTACLADRDLDSIAAAAGDAGFGALEVAAWPATEAQARDHTASHIDVRRFGQADVDAVRELFARHELIMSAVRYYDNNPHPDPDRRAKIHEHPRACIRTASLLDVPCVGTFVGRDPGRTVEENRELANLEFPPLEIARRTLQPLIVA